MAGLNNPLDEEQAPGVPQSAQLRELKNAFVRSLPFDEGTRELMLLGVSWDEIAGNLSARTRPEKIENEALYVSVAGGVYMQEFSFQSKTILKKVQNLIPRIRRIMIVQSRSG
jgi:hypothetical protein